MKRAFLVLALLGAGCMEERNGPSEATPIDQGAIKVRPPGPPVAVKPPAPRPEPVAEPVAPSGPSGLTRVKLGDLVEFSWSRVGEVKVDAAQAMAMAMGSAGGPKQPQRDLKQTQQDIMNGKINPTNNGLGSDLTRLKGVALPKPQVKTGTLSIVRIEPETPFTFRVELKTGKDSQQQVYAYKPDIAISKVVFSTSPDDPKKPTKAAGKLWDCVETPARLVAPQADELALAGGLVEETSPETTRPGAVSVALTRFGTSKATAADKGSPKMLDTFETPISIAMGMVSDYGTQNREDGTTEDADNTVHIATAAATCTSVIKQPKGRLGGLILKGKIESLTWNGKPAPKPFDKCIRQKTKGLRLTLEETAIDIPIGQAL